MTMLVVKVFVLQEHFIFGLCLSVNTTFARKALSNFYYIWDVSWCYGLVVLNVESLLNFLASIKCNKN